MLDYPYESISPAHCAFLKAYKSRVWWRSKDTLEEKETWYLYIWR